MIVNSIRVYNSSGNKPQMYNQSSVFQILVQFQSNVHGHIKIRRVSQF